MKSMILEIQTNQAGFPFLRLRGKNGKVVFNTEAFDSASNARRAAKRLGDMRKESVELRDYTRKSGPTSVTL